MSVYSNLAGSASEGAAQYIAAVLELLGAQDPMSVLESTVGWCTDATSALTADQLAAPEAEGKWSVAGVLQHLADSELVWGYRLRRVLAEDRPTLEGFDQDQWASRLGYHEADRDESLSLFAAVRASNLVLLARAGPVGLDRVGIHGERGEEPVRHMLRLYAGHDLVHRRQLQRLIGALA